MTEVGSMLIAGLVSLAVLAILMRLAARLGLVDHPRGRKDHDLPIPVVGGIAILCGLCAGVLASADPTPATLGLLISGAFLVAVGALDDRFDLSWRWRILAQVGAAALLAVLGDLELHRLGYGEPPLSLALGVFTLPVTVFSIVGLINAVNMIDGIDGLAGSLVLASMVAMLLLYPGGAEDLRLTLVLASVAIVVFLLFNLRVPGRPRALTFLGNSGSALLGLVLAWAAIRLTQDASPVVTPALGPWLVALPIIDCLALIARRLREGRSPFSADRSHLHHLLLDRGWSVPQVVAIALLIHASLAVAGVALHAAGVPDIGLIGTFVLLIAVYYLLTGMLRTGGRPERMAAIVPIAQGDGSGLR